MEKENSKLYLENCYFMEQNEKLRKAAEFLEKQNQVLLNKLQQRVAATAAASFASCITNTTSESSIREADQSSTTSASEASTSTRTRAPKSRKHSKK